MNALGPMWPNNDGRPSAIKVPINQYNLCNSVIKIQRRWWVM